MEHSSAIIAARAIQDEIKSARERTGFVDVIPGIDVLARIIDKHLNQDTKSKNNNNITDNDNKITPSAIATWTNLHRIAEMIRGNPFSDGPEPQWVIRTLRDAADLIRSLSVTCTQCKGERPDYLPCRKCKGSGIEPNAEHPNGGQQS